MRDHDWTRQSQELTTDANGNTTAILRDSYRHLFTFTGFGSNDKRRKKSPTAGSYEIRETHFSRGSRIQYSRPFWFSPWEFQSQVSGVTEALPGYSTNWASLHQSYSNTVRNRAIDKFYDELHKTETNLAVSLGEFRETTRMVDKAVKSAWSWVTTARRFRRELARNPSIVASNLWLSYKYGWYPACQDVYNLLNWAWRSFDEITVIGKSHRKESIGIVREYDAANGISRTYTGYNKFSTLIQCTVRIKDQTAFDRSRITSLNPMAIAWELMPLSFVFDWAIDIGGYLNILEKSAASGLELVNGFETNLVIQKLQVLLEQNYEPGLYSRYSGSAQAQYYRVLKQRVVLNSFPRPWWPTVNLSLGSQRIISAAALARNILLGRVR